MKYRGKVRVTLELIKELLRLPENVEITNIITTDEDLERETVTLCLMSKEKTDATLPVVEGAKVPYVNLGGYYEKNIL